MKFRLLLSVSLFCAMRLFAQTDTLHLSLQEAEKMFLDKNLSLLASKYNIDASTALIKQAKLWENPLLLTDQNLYDGKFFNHSKTPSKETSGQVYIQVQELLRTAGKIKKLTALATANSQISELQFEQAMHNLRYALRNDLYQTSQLFSSIQLYEKQNEQLRKLLSAMDAQLKAGNISQKDFLRIQALQISGLQEEAEYKKQLADVQSELHILLNEPVNAFVLSEQPGEKVNTPVVIDSLINSAKENNADYLLEKENLLYSQNYLRYQQALRSPDVSVGVEYDKANSYVPNYYGLTVSLPLPIINRNQGNIASAGFTVKQEQTLVSEREFRLKNDIENALNKLQLNFDLRKNVDPDFIRKYDLLMKNAFNAYQQREMNLLDFLDLFSAYKDTQLKYLQQQYNLQKAKEDLNLLVGKDVIN